jgi:hypothetical protein
MELYAEYTIKNSYLVSASPLLAFIRRQFLEQEYVTDDEATNEVGKNVENDDSIAYAVHTYLQDIKDVQLSIQKYRSNGSLANETDQRRWSTVDPITFTYYDDDKIIPSSDSTYSTADFRYNDVFQPKQDNVDQPLDGITNKDVTQLKQDTQIADSESAIRYWDITSNIGGTFYQTTSAIHSSSTDIKDSTKTGINDSSNQLDVFDRTVVYDRSQIPLVSLDPAAPSDTYSSLLTPANKTDTYGAVGGDWTWDGSTYTLNYAEVRIGVGYIRTPTLTGFQATLTAGSSTVTLTSGTTDGLYNGLLLSKISGSGAFNSSARVYSVVDNLTFTVTLPHVTSGIVSFSAIGDTTQLGELLSSPTDTFPDGSTQGLVKFSFSGSSWDKTTTAADAFDRTATYSRTNADSSPAVDIFPDGSTQGLVKFSFSGASWTDTLSSPADSTPVRTWDKAHADSINNINTGTLYYNAYNQNDASDPNSSYSYEAQTYSVHDTRAIS